MCRYNAPRQTWFLLTAWTGIAVTNNISISCRQVIYSIVTRLMYLKEYCLTFQKIFPQVWVGFLAAVVSFLLLTDFCFCRQMLKPSCLPGVEGIGRRVRIASGQPHWMPPSLSLHVFPAWFWVTVGVTLIRYGAFWFSGRFPTVWAGGRREGASAGYLRG